MFNQILYSIHGWDLSHEQITTHTICAVICFESAFFVKSLMSWSLVAIVTRIGRIDILNLVLMFIIRYWLHDMCLDYQFNLMLKKK